MAYATGFLIVAKSDLVLTVFGLAIGAFLIEWYLRNQSANVALDPSYGLEYDPFAYTGSNPPPAPMTASVLFQPSVVPYMQYQPFEMKTSQAGIQNVVHWEGRRNQAYQDSAGNWSIGIGHLIVPGDGLNAQSNINDATVDAIFANDLNEAENIVKANVTVPLTQGQFDALVDFAFQFGNALGTSTLLRLLNAGDYAAAANEFAQWVHARNSAGQLVQVGQLVNRRAAATSMFG
jgi:lysozyme